MKNIIDVSNMNEFNKVLYEYYIGGKSFQKNY